MGGFLNEYGDALVPTTGRHGADIASQRRDDLDEAALAAVRPTPEFICADFGCGRGEMGLAFASAGATGHLYDQLPEPAAFASRQAPARVRYHQTDLRRLQSDMLPERLDLAFCQRTIHYLDHDEALAFVGKVLQRLAPNSFFFLSASGLGSELGKGYPHADYPPSRRFARLAPAMRAKHNIEAPVCLYTETDLAALMATAGFETERSWRSPFGNIKGIFRRPGHGA